jgi:hypothetical protein
LAAVTNILEEPITSIFGVILSNIINNGQQHLDVGDVLGFSAMWFCMSMPMFSTEDGDSMFLQKLASTYKTT